jgi:hypothetical protein
MEKYQYTHEQVGEIGKTDTSKIEHCERRHDNPHSEVLHKPSCPVIGMERESKTKEEI